MGPRTLVVACFVALAAMLVVAGVWMSRTRREGEGRGNAQDAEIAPGGQVSASDRCDAAPAPRRSRSKLAEELGGEAVLAVLEKPDRASAIRTRFQLAGSGESPDAYTPFGERVSIGPEARSRLSTLLIDDRSWDFDARFGCCMSHRAVRFQFEGGGHVVDLVVSFGNHTSVTFLDGARMAYQNPDPAARRLIQIGRELFPDDGQLRLLETRGFGCKPRPDDGGFFGEGRIVY